MKKAMDCILKIEKRIRVEKDVLFLEGIQWLFIDIYCFGDWKACSRITILCFGDLAIC